MRPRQNALLLALLVAVGIGLPLDVRADIAVFVGYADNLRPSPFFPTPFDTGVGLFAGVSGQHDSGAIRIDNTGASPITINSLDVTVPTFFVTSSSMNNWTAFLPFTLGPGQTAVFTNTSTNFNSAAGFDTSDFGHSGLNSASNCDPGNAFAIANPATCAAIAPTVVVTLQGSPPQTFVDTGQVLDTGGFDFVNSNPCPVAGDVPGACNESLQWRPIGTTGIGNPGGVPEPASLALLAAAAALGMGLARRSSKKYGQ